MSITEAFINTYGEEQLRAAFHQCASEQQKYDTFKALYKRDAPHLFRSRKWGSVRLSYNALMNRLFGV